MKPDSVIEKLQLPPSGDKHDYISLTPYYWPDQTKPNGLPYIARDGIVNPETFSVPDLRNLENMMQRVSTLSLAYYFTNNVTFASKARDLLQVWFLNKSTHMNPNLQFAQMKVGTNNGSPEGIIDAHDLPKVIDAIGLIQHSPSWTTKDQTGIDNWFSQYLDWLLNSPFGKKEAEATNNHGTWYDAQASSIALFLNNTCAAKQIFQGSAAKRIVGHIQPDGSQPFELQRTKSWDYSIFNLQGLFELAAIGEHLRIDLWNYKTPQGASLETAIDYLIPYVLKNQTWPYQQITPITTNGLVDLLHQAAIHYHSLSYIYDYEKIERNNGTIRTDNLLYAHLLRTIHS
jgi:hypothetical protein